jgi:hypothetical protein
MTLMHRSLAGISKVVGHPAFWMPILLVMSVHLYTDGLHLHVQSIRSDGWGYYLPLPAIFVYGDPHLAFLNRPDLAGDVLQYRFDDGSWQGLSVHGAGYLDKYSFGPAVLQLPFFLVALLISHFIYATVNGFEGAFQIACSVSGVLYFGLGSFLIFSACRLRYDTLPSALALAVMILGSNVLQYAAAAASYAHIYGYCLVAALIYLTVLRADSAEPPPLREFVLFGALMGLAVMTRPTNVVYSLLFIVFARRTLWQDLLVGSACAFLVAAVAASPQMIWWYVTTGMPIYYSYGGEGFNFDRPQLGRYLFSVRKGLFFWHPLYLVMFATLLWTLRRRPLETVVSALIVEVAIYIGASWFDVTFGHSFGSRQSVELLPVLSVPFAGAIALILKSRWRWVASVVAVLLIAINLIQYRGYIDGALLGNNNTWATYTRFWSHIGNTGDRAIGGSHE